MISNSVVHPERPRPSVPFIPDNAPFTPSQRAWLNGFLAGIFSSTPFTETEAGDAPNQAAKQVTVTVLFGSESGNCEALAKRVAKTAQQKGFGAKVAGLDKLSPPDLAREKYVLIITSTFGDGDPPENARAFHAALQAPTQPQLDHLAYSVLALGDRNYEQFCKCGIDFDVRLAALGAKRIYERVDCDVDYEAAAQRWESGVFSVIASMANDVPRPASHEAPTASTRGTGGHPKTHPTSSGATRPSLAAAPAIGTPPFSRKNPFPARLLTNRKLTGDGSAKETRHFEISLDGSDLTYQPGDALGVIPANCPALVNELLRVLNRDGEEAVAAPDGGEVALRTALLRHYEITRIPDALLRAVAARSADRALLELCQPGAAQALTNYLAERDVTDLLTEFASVTFTPAELVAHFRKLTPRLYSISSSFAAHPSEVHLTVAAVRYESHGRKRKGVCSTYLADRAQGDVPIFVHPSDSFRLPKSGDTPVIMVGPGTGIAPFRAFLHERRIVGAKGRNWLFFGEQRAATDFFYRDELEQMCSDGHLTRLTTAFSRDQQARIYVQDRMQEHSTELWKWLEDGAQFYVCGDAKRMAKDVDATLHAIIERCGRMSREAAADYVRQLKATKRYQRDVY